MLPNNSSMIDASSYAYARDAILHKCTFLAIEYKILEEIVKPYQKEDTIVSKTKILHK